jgi:hypothetical protein
VNGDIKMTTLNKRFGKAKPGCAAERRYVFAQLEDVEYQINQVHITGIEPMCGLEALREVRDGYRRDIEEMSK